MLKNMSSQTKNNAITYGMVIGAFIVVQIMISTGNITRLLEGLLVPLSVYIILAVSLNLVVGIMGDLSLGHAGFMCVGAFSGAFFVALVRDTAIAGGLRFFLAIIIGALFAGLFGLLVGIPVLRLRGDYLAIVTLAFGEIIMNVTNSIFVGRDGNGLHFSLRNARVLNMEPDGVMLINGPLGIIGTPRDSTFLIGVILILITVFIVTNIINSRDGRAIMAIRDNRIAAESIGVNITKYKLLAFSVSAALAGVAGVLYAHNLATLTATANNFGFNMSVMILVFVVLGGIGNIRGSIIAAIVLTLLPELMRGLADFRMLMYAVVLIAMMLLNWAPKVIEWREKYGLKITFTKVKAIVEEKVKGGR